MTPRTVDELANRVQGKVIGDGSRQITDANSLSAAGPGEVTFAIDERNLKKLEGRSAGACLIGQKLEELASRLPVPTAWIVVADPMDAFLILIQDFRPAIPRNQAGISPAAFVDPTASIGPGTTIYPGAFIGPGTTIGSNCEILPGVYIGRNCVVGSQCIFHPHVVLYDAVSLGDRVILHAGAVLGADGFGYRFRNGVFEKIPQLGTVRIDDDVEIGANATVDRGMIGPTIVGTGTKLDNMVMIGHNCELGKHNVFASQVGLAGSVTTGDYVRMAGQVGIADHIQVGKGCTIGAKSGVHRDVPPGETHLGSPARPEAEEIKILMATGRTPEMRKQLRELESRLAALEKQLAAATDEKA